MTVTKFSTLCTEFVRTSYPDNSFTDQCAIARSLVEMKDCVKFNRGANEPHEFIPLTNVSAEKRDVFTKFQEWVYAKFPNLGSTNVGVTQGQGSMEAKQDEDRKRQANEEAARAQLADEEGRKRRNEEVKRLIMEQEEQALLEHQRILSSARLRLAEAKLSAALAEADREFAEAAAKKADEDAKKAEEDAKKAEAEARKAGTEEKIQSINNRKRQREDDTTNGKELDVVPANPKNGKKELGLLDCFVIASGSVGHWARQQLKIEIKTPNMPP